MNVFLYQKDFSDKGNDRYFIFSDDLLAEKTAEEIAGTTEEMICHDYWMIAPAIYSTAKCLPTNVIDIFEFSIATSGSKKTRGLRERHEIKGLFSDSDTPHEHVKEYLDIFYRVKDFDPTYYSSIGNYLQHKWEKLLDGARKSGELKRQTDIEIPVFNKLNQHIVPGIFINTEILKVYKKNIDHEYYLALKNFSAKHNHPIEVPSDQAVLEYLEPKGVDFSGISIDYVLKFVPIEGDFTTDVLALRKLSSSRNLLLALSSSKRRAIPVIDTFGSSTSRIYFKDPTFQNLAKKFRNIVIPDTGKKLAYVDYDQFEVGVMAALSKDPHLLRLYASGDLYSALSKYIFDDPIKRKFSKRLFLSYAYGMKLKRIFDAGQANGANRSKIKEFFKRFEVFEAWKESVQEIFYRQGKISTSEGNFLVREASEAAPERKAEWGPHLPDPLTEKEKRSCVSQVVQGTASLIFKKAILEIASQQGVRILIPMHDALLVEHEEKYDANNLVAIFSSVMTKHFENSIEGQASLQVFG